MFKAYDEVDSLGLLPRWKLESYAQDERALFIMKMKGELNRLSNNREEQLYI